MMKAIERILKEIREAKTVSDGLIIQNRELRAKLKQVQAELAEAEADTASVDEAVELLDAMESEGQAALAENTDGTFTPSGN